MSTKLTYVTLEDDEIGSLAAVNVVLTNAVAGYPGSKVCTIEMADTARGTAPKLQIDFRVAIAAKFWAVLNHNMIAGSSPVIASYSDAAFTTPTGESLTLTYRASDMKGYDATLTAQQYWQIDFSGCSFTDAFCEIGKVIASSTIHTFTNDFSEFQRGLLYRNIHNETIGGTAYVHRIASRRFTFNLSWNASAITPALTEILELLDLTRGGAYPFLLIPDNDETEFYYVRADDAADWQESEGRIYLTGKTLRMGELSRGKIQVV